MDPFDSNLQDAADLIKQAAVSYAEAKLELSAAEAAATVARNNLADQEVQVTALRQRVEIADKRLLDLLRTSLLMARRAQSTQHHEE